MTMRIPGRRKSSPGIHGNEVWKRQKRRLSAGVFRPVLFSRFHGQKRRFRGDLVVLRILQHVEDLRRRIEHRAVLVDLGFLRDLLDLELLRGELHEPDFPAAVLLFSRQDVRIRPHHEDVFRIQLVLLHEVHLVDHEVEVKLAVVAERHEQHGQPGRPACRPRRG